MNVSARLGSLRKFVEKRRGQQLICLYRTQTGEERRGSIADMIADNGEFLRMLSGNRLEDLDRMLAYEKERIHEQY